MVLIVQLEPDFRLQSQPTSTKQTVHVSLSSFLDILMAFLKITATVIMRKWNEGNRLWKLNSRQTGADSQAAAVWCELHNTTSKQMWGRPTRCATVVGHLHDRPQTSTGCRQPLSDKEFIMKTCRSVYIFFTSCEARTRQERRHVKGTFNRFG